MIGIRWPIFRISRPRDVFRRRKGLMVRVERLEKDLRALAKQQEILLKRWGELHDRLVVLEDPVKRAAQDLGLQDYAEDKSQRP